MLPRAGRKGNKNSTIADLSGAPSKLAGPAPVRQHPFDKQAERHFLLSLFARNPEWPLLETRHVTQLPGIRWKLHNLAQLQKANPQKFDEQAASLRRLLA